MQFAVEVLAYCAVFNQTRTKGLRCMEDGITWGNTCDWTNLDSSSDCFKIGFVENRDFLEYVRRILSSLDLSFCDFFCFAEKFNLYV